MNPISVTAPSSAVTLIALASTRESHSSGSVLGHGSTWETRNIAVVIKPVEVAENFARPDKNADACHHGSSQVAF
jgi:hypothetical protein